MNALPQPIGAGSSTSGRVLVVLVAAVAVIMTVFGASYNATAQYARSVVWDHYDVTLDLNPDGSYHVVERQVVDFQGGPFSSGFADIPMGRIDDIEHVVVKEETANGVVTYQQFLWCGDDVASGEFTWGESEGLTSVRWGFETTYDEQRTFLLSIGGGGSNGGSPSRGSSGFG